MTIRGSGHFVTMAMEGFFASQGGPCGGTQGLTQCPPMITDPGFLAFIPPKSKEEEEAEFWIRKVVVEDILISDAVELAMEVSLDF